MQHTKVYLKCQPARGIFLKIQQVAQSLIYRVGLTKSGIFVFHFNER